MQTYYSIKRRLITVVTLLAFLFVLITARLSYVQLVKGGELRKRAYGQWMRQLPLTAERGDILDCNGKVLVGSARVYDVYARPKSVKDPKDASESLSIILNLSREEIEEKLTRKGVSDIRIKRGIEPSVADMIREKDLQGIYLAASTKRSYADGTTLSQVLGFVSADNTGQAGIEAFYEKYLKGIDGKILTPSDLIGDELKSDYIDYIGAKKGCSVVLTIDAEIQKGVETVLDIAYKAHSPKRASCLVLDVTNGDILAIASRPGVDLNNLPRGDIELLQNNTRSVLLTDVYEPGSTFKILTAATSLEEYRKGNPKAFGVAHIFTNNSNYRIVDKGARIKCWTSHANGRHCNQNISDALKNSCNPIFTDIALSLGKDTFYEYLKNFGYGQKSGIDSYGEQSGLLISRKSVTNGDLARIGFGQSIAVTALQLAMATSAAVNGGYLYTPHLVKRIEDENGVVREVYPEVRSRPISEETSKELRKMLENVVANGGGKNAYIEGYEVGGKTGTAQKFENGKIARGKYVSSFVGFFPTSEPKYLALVVIDEPVGQSYGSIVAAPYAKLIFEKIIYLKDVRPRS